MSVFIIFDYNFYLSLLPFPDISSTYILWILLYFLDSIPTFRFFQRHIRTVMMTVSCRLENPNLRLLDLENFAITWMVGNIYCWNKLLQSVQRIRPIMSPETVSAMKYPKINVRYNFSVSSLAFHSNIVWYLITFRERNRLYNPTNGNIQIRNHTWQG